MARRLTTLLLMVAALCPVLAQRAGPRQTTPSAASRDWPTFGFDITRSSVSTAPAGIDASGVAALERQRVTIDEPVDASAIFLKGVTIGGAPHDTFFVTTIAGRTLAIDADSGNVLWRFAPPGIESWTGTRQITNTTPTADPGRAFIYSASPDGKIHKIAVADGRAVWSTAITKLPAREKIASPLSFFRGRIIAATGGYIGDAPPYQGHIAILDAETGALQHVWNALCSDRRELIDPSTCPESGAAIWGRAGVIIDPATGDLFLATGDGKWDGRTHWGDAVIHLNADATTMLGNFTPENTDMLETRDLDVGSTSPVWLGGGLIAQGGKDLVVRLLTIAQMNGTDPHRGGEQQSLPTPSGARLFTAPAVSHSGTATRIFAADGGGTTAWTLANGKLEQIWHDGAGGTSPVLAGDLLYVYNPAGGLRVYEPGTGRVLTTLECGTGHWNSPIVVDGRILLTEGAASRGRGAPAPTQGVVDIWRASKR